MNDEKYEDLRKKLFHIAIDASCDVEDIESVEYGNTNVDRIFERAKEIYNTFRNFNQDEKTMGGELPEGWVWDWRTEEQKEKDFESYLEDFKKETRTWREGKEFLELPCSVLMDKIQDIIDKSNDYSSWRGSSHVVNGKGCIVLVYGKGKFPNVCAASSRDCSKYSEEIYNKVFK